METAGKILKKILIGAGTFFAVTFTIYITNAENKLRYYVVRPFLNKHYDKQSRNRRV